MAVEVHQIAVVERRERGRDEELVRPGEPVGEQPGGVDLHAVERADRGDRRSGGGVEGVRRPE